MFLLFLLLVTVIDREHIEFVPVECSGSFHVRSLPISEVSRSTLHDTCLRIIICSLL
jgi:hypothetical protein